MNVMRATLSLLAMALWGIHALAQKTYTYRDSIFTTRGDTIIGRISFLADDTVYYNYYLADSSIGSKTIARSEIKRNGLSPKRTEILQEEDKHINGVPGASLSEKYSLKGLKDAEKYYDDYSSAGTGTLMVSLLSPLVGLIPAISSSSTMPKDKNLNYPNTKLMENADYRSGYTRRAKKIKQSRVWTNWGIALGVNAIVVVLLSSASNGAQ